MSVSAQGILNAVNRAKLSLGDLVIQAVLTRVTNTGYANLKPTQATETATLDGFYGDWDESDILAAPRGGVGTNIESNDVKFYVFEGSLSPKVGDTLEVDSVTFTIVQAKPTKIGSLTAITMLQLRK